MRYAALILIMLAAPAAASAQDVELRFTGDVRVRAEGRRAAPENETDAFTLLRSRLGLIASLSPDAHAYVQLQDSRTFGEEASTMDGAADELDVHQAFVELGWRPTAALPLAVRAGRQEIVLGDERLVGAVDWTNTGRAFDGVRLFVRPDEAFWRASLHAATVAERGTLAGEPDPAGSRNDYLTFGARLDAGPLALQALHDVSAVWRTYRGIDRTTLDAALRVPGIAPWVVRVEGAYQLGDHALIETGAQQDIRAHFLSARAGREPVGGTVSRLSLGADYLSGDEDPESGDFDAFNTLYATNHKFYGYLDAFVDPAWDTRGRGLIDLVGAIAVRAGERAQLALDVHRFSLAERFPDSDERELGWELDLTVPVEVGPGQRLVAGYSAFRNGPAAGLLGHGDDGTWRHWGYAQLSFTFGPRFADAPVPAL